MTLEQITARIAEIDRTFAAATGWGSWMASVSAERRGLVREAAKLGVIIEDNYVLRTAGGAVSD